MIHLHRVEKTYPPHQTALRALDLSVEAGEFLFIAGASGAGKSTLLKLLYGHEKATRGEILVAGRNLQQIRPAGIARLRREIGVVFQDYKLLPHRTVLENVSLPLEVRGVASRERAKAATRLLEMLGMEEKTVAYPPMLSGGEQQRVALARAFIHKPRLIIADEPTGNLDAKMARVVFDLFEQANKTGASVLVATHNLSMVEEFGKRTLVLDRGKLVGDFTAKGEGAV